MNILILPILWIFMLFTVVNSFRQPVMRRRQNNRNNQAQILINTQNNQY
jgi:hypothetical protein